MIKYDTATRKITCPVGDTGLFVVTLTSADGEALGENLSGVAIFAVATKTFSPVFHKVVSIANNTATIRLTNADTRVLTRGEYRWDIRVVTDPDYDAGGNVICSDAADDVRSPYSATGLPVFEVTGWRLIWRTGMHLIISVIFVFLVYRVRKVERLLL